MSDITERLREIRDRDCYDAADEIERLRAELAAANGHITDLIDALRQADLWTDEEHDRAPWRLAAKCVIDAALAKGGGDGR